MVIPLLPWTGDRAVRIFIGVTGRRWRGGGGFSVRRCGVIGLLLAMGMAALSSGFGAEPANRDESLRLERSITAPAGGDGVAVQGAAAWLEAVGRAARR